MSYTKEELERYWSARCPVCGWRDLSRDCEGGGQIADTGDYSDCYCPECFERGDDVVVEDDE